MRKSQRILKFRAWVPKHKKFYLWGIGDIEGNESLFTGPPADPTAIHQQFTGLCDKNGKEIYEGDVVLVPGGDSMESAPFAICKVSMNSGAWGYQYGKRFESFLELIGTNTDKDDESEIIGNIYENPELLEGA